MKRSLTFKPNPDGSHDVNIVFHNARLRPNRDCSLWWIINHEGYARQRVNCGGHPIKARIVVKLYCRVSQNLKRIIEKRRVLESIRKKSPLLLT